MQDIIYLPFLPFPDTWETKLISHLPMEPSPKPGALSPPEGHRLESTRALKATGSDLHVLPASQDTASEGHLPRETDAGKGEKNDRHVQSAAGGSSTEDEKMFPICQIRCGEEDGEQLSLPSPTGPREEHCGV